MRSPKTLTLEDVRRDPSLLDKFIKQHPSQADKERFEALLSETSKTLPKDDPTSR